MSEIGKFFVTVGSKFDKAGFDKARAAINKVALAGIAMGAALAVAAVKAAGAAGIQEKAEFILASALKNTKNATGVSIDELKKYASNLQAVTTVGDETSLKTMQLGLSMGISAEEIGDATKQAIGLSKAYQVDLNASMKLVALGRAGEFSMMARYIPQLRGMTDKTKMAAIANEAMAKGFEIAKAETQTYLGMVEQLTNILGDLWEDVGFKIIPVFKDYIKIIKEQIVPGVKSWIDESGNIESVIKKVVAIVKFGAVTTFAFAKTIGFAIDAVKVANETFSSWGMRINQVKAALSGNIGMAKAFGKMAVFHSKRAKEGYDKLTESVIETGIKIDEMNKLDLESFTLKEETKEEIKIEKSENEKARLDEEFEVNKERSEAEAIIFQDMQDRKAKKKAETEEAIRVEDRRTASAISRGILMVAELEVLTMRTGVKAFGEAMKQRVKQYIMTKQVELVAAKTVALAKAVFASATTWGAASWQIGVILGQFAAAVGALHAIQKFEKGGVVGGALGQPQLAVVHGGETVIPNGGGMGNIYVTVPAINSRRTANEYGKVVGDAIFNKLKKSRRI